MRIIAKTLGTVALFALAACGGGTDEQPPVQTPAPAPAPTPAPPPADTAPAPAADTTPPPKPAIADLIKTALGAMSTNVGDAAKLSALYAPDAAVWSPGSPEVKGRDAIQASNQALYDAINNEKMVVTRAWVKDNVAAVEWVFSGTQGKDFMGIPASDKPFGITGASVLTFNDDGLITKEHAYWDVDTYIAQVTGKGKARAIPDVSSVSTEWHWAKKDAGEDANVALVNKQNGAFPADPKTFSDLLADDGVFVDLGSPKPTTDKAHLKGFVTALLKAWPDTKSLGNDVFGVEDFTVDEWENQAGPQKADFVLPDFKVKNTKKPIDIHGLDVLQWKDGKVAKSWTYENNAEFETQIGLAPAGAAKADAKTADAKKADAKKVDAKKGDKKADAKKPAAPATK